MTELAMLLDRVKTRRSLPDPSIRRLLRLKAEITQAEFAEAMGVERVTLTRWENGTRTPRGEDLTRYVQALDELASIVTTKAS